MYEHDPDHHPQIKRGKPQAKMNPPAFAQMIASMFNAGRTVRELALATGLHEWTVRAYAKSLVIARVAYVEGWGKDSLGRDVSAKYRLGFGVNVPREHQTGAQKMRKRREALRKQALSINTKHRMSGLEGE